MATVTQQTDDRHLVVAHWPHLRRGETTATIMWSVAAALMPALLAGAYFFGIRVFMHAGLATVAAVGTEALIQRLRGKKISVGDGSAVVTGILVAFCLPAHAGWYVPIVASIVGIAIAKHCFGGLGANIWNPALVGRAFVHNSFAGVMNQPSPLLESGHFTANVGTMGNLPAGVDATTGASPMAEIKQVATGGLAPSEIAEALDSPAGHEKLWDLFIGNVSGNIGETSALLLLVGAAYLIYRGWVRWQVPLAYLVVVAAGALLLPLNVAGGGGASVWRPIVSFAPGAAPEFVLWHLLGGGLMLGALYMATDMVTSPMTSKGLWIFGAGCGVLTILIRLYGGYPEAVCYSILLMNTAVPLIDRWTQNRIYGHAK